MNYNDIKDLINTVVGTDIMCFELNYNGVDVKIDRNKKVTVSNEAITTASSENIAYKEAPKQVTNNFVVENTNVQNEVTPQKDGNKVKSPIVGTFYAANSPTAEPFIKVGSKVKKGDVIFIIEAMKVINEITSDFDGEVLDILVKDGELVEYDQTIVVIG